MVSPTQWTWVWVSSSSWWWTGRPSMLWFMGSQRVGYDWVSELNWILFDHPQHMTLFIFSFSRNTLSLGFFGTNIHSWFSSCISITSKSCPTWPLNISTLLKSSLFSFYVSSLNLTHALNCVSYISRKVFPTPICLNQSSLWAPGSDVQLLSLPWCLGYLKLNMTQTKFIIPTHLLLSPLLCHIFPLSLT